MIPTVAIHRINFDRVFRVFILNNFLANSGVMGFIVEVYIIFFIFNMIIQIYNI